MEFKNFDDLIKSVQESSVRKTVVVVAAHDEHTLEAVFKARENNIVDNPILVGKKDEIKTIINSLGENLEDEFIIDTKNDVESAEIAVKIIREGKASFIMKGLIQTKDLLKEVVNRDTGLRTGNVMSHIAINELPGYHKLIAVTDGGMMVYPDLENKKGILLNAVETFNNMGYENPKVAVLTAVETVNPKMIETVDANELKELNKSGEIKNCIVEGPISYDLTMSKESAKIKGFESPVVGDADILLVPNMTTGNILSKALIYSANAKMAGFIVGAKVPIVLTSRGSSSLEKYLSIVISASAAK